MTANTFEIQNIMEKTNDENPRMLKCPEMISKYCKNAKCLNVANVAKTLKMLQSL